MTEKEFESTYRCCKVIDLFMALNRAFDELDEYEIKMLKKALRLAAKENEARRDKAKSE